MKIWLLLFFLWIVWKVMGSVFDEIQRRKNNQQTKRTIDETKRREIDTAEQLSSSSRVHPTVRPAAREMHQFSARSAEPVETELERLLREAMEQKRQQKSHAARPSSAASASRPPSPPARTRTHAEPPPFEVVPPRPVQTHPDRRHYQAQQKHVVHRPRHVLPHAAVPTRTPPDAAKRAGKRQAQETPTRAACAVHPFLGRLDKNQIRRAVVLAEVLGVPKGLRDIESHTV